MGAKAKPAAEATLYATRKRGIEPHLTAEELSTAGLTDPASVAETAESLTKVGLADLLNANGVPPTSSWSKPRLVQEACLHCGAALATIARDSKLVRPSARACQASEALLAFTQYYETELGIWMAANGLENRKKAREIGVIYSD